MMKPPRRGHRWPVELRVGIVVGLQLVEPWAPYGHGWHVLVTVVLFALIVGLAGLWISRNRELLEAADLWCGAGEGKTRNDARGRCWTLHERREDAGTRRTVTNDHT